MLKNKKWIGVSVLSLTLLQPIAQGGYCSPSFGNSTQFFQSKNSARPNTFSNSRIPFICLPFTLLILQYPGLFKVQKGQRFDKSTDGLAQQTDGSAPVHSKDYISTKRIREGRGKSKSFSNPRLTLKKDKNLLQLLVSEDLEENSLGEVLLRKHIEIQFSSAVRKDAADSWEQFLNPRLQKFTEKVRGQSEEVFLVSYNKLEREIRSGRELFYPSSSPSKSKFKAWRNKFSDKESYRMTIESSDQFEPTESEFAYETTPDESIAGWSDSSHDSWTYPEPDRPALDETVKIEKPNTLLFCDTSETIIGYNEILWDTFGEDLLRVLRAKIKKQAANLKEQRAIQLQEERRSAECIEWESAAYEQIARKTVRRKTR